MSILNNVTQGPSQTGVRVLISGLEGAGKTTLVCGSPNALLIPLEQGYGAMTIDKVPMLTSFSDVMQLLEEITEQCQNGTFQYTSLVFDSCTALERLIHQHVLENDPMYVKGNGKAVTMESAAGGYGKAYSLANELFSNFLAACDALVVHANINICMTCHVFAATLIDPTVGEFSSWDLLLHSPKNQKTYGKREIATQWFDIIGFLHEAMYITEGKNMNKGISANKGKTLALNRSPSYVAKNRYGIGKDIAIPAVDGWNHLAQAIFDNSGIDVFNRD